MTHQRAKTARVQASETFQTGDGWTRPYALPFRGRFSGHRRDSECCSCPGKHLACTSVFWDCIECLIKSNYAAVFSEFSEFSEFPCKPRGSYAIKYVCMYVCMCSRREIQRLQRRHQRFNNRINRINRINRCVLLKETFVRKRIQTISFSNRNSLHCYKRSMQSVAWHICFPSRQDLHRNKSSSSLIYFY